MNEVTQEVPSSPAIPEAQSDTLATPTPTIVETPQAMPIDMAIQQQPDVESTTLGTPPVTEMTPPATPIDFQRPLTSGPAMSPEDNSDEIRIENETRGTGSSSAGFSLRKLFKWGSRGE